MLRRLWISANYHTLHFFHSSDALLSARWFCETARCTRSAHRVVVLVVSFLHGTLQQSWPPRCASAFNVADRETTDWKLPFPRTVCPHWRVLTVIAKAGAWSGCSSWSAAFYLQIFAWSGSYAMSKFISTRASGIVHLSCKFPHK